MFNRKIKVVLVQLGSPEKLSWWGLFKYLKEFLEDTRVIDIPKIIWRPILYLFVLPFRPSKSLKAYKRLYDQGFPLVLNTERFKNKLIQYLPNYFEVNALYLLNNPRVENGFQAWNLENKETRADKVLFLPQFPQYTEATVAAGIDRLCLALSKQVNIPNIEIITSYATSKAFIDNSVKQIKKFFKGTHLFLSFHGIPKRRVTVKEDIYFEECSKTFECIQKQLPHIPMTLCFQSRFGNEEWLKPYTSEIVNEYFIHHKEASIYSPSFVADCLETTDELGHELVEEVKGTLHFIPCLNDDDQWAKDYATFIQTLIEGSLLEKRNLFY